MDNAREWIPHEIKAKKRHEADLKSKRISVLWLRGNPDQFATWQQFKAIVRVIEVLNRLLLTSHGAIHFQAGIKGKSTPKVSWVESPSDMPKGKQ